MNPTSPSFLGQSLGEATAQGLRPGCQQLPLSQGFCRGGKTLLCYLSTLLGGKRPPRPAPDLFPFKSPDPRSGVV